MNVLLKVPESDECIHIVQLTRGNETVHRSVTMLKSLLYFQHRLPANKIEVTSTSTCLNDTRAEYTRTAIHVHVIVERATLPLVQATYSKWNVKDFYWHFYDMDKYLHLGKWIPNRHESGITSLMKIFLPTMLPDRLEKVSYFG
ncbi:unnamed protein product [Dicrocoelium dendriticum]|nr:unnamed protein product [Dicrocoelium dendriticum]